MARGKKTVSAFSYKSYSWGGDHDPIIDSFHTCMEDAGFSASQVAEASDISVNTIHNWLDGRVKRPQHTTIKAAIRSLPGYDYEITKNGRAISKLRDQ